MIRPMRGVAPKTALSKFPYYVSPKIDGIRALVRDGVVLSKTMKPIPNKHIQEMFRDLHGFDGELTVGPPHKEFLHDDVYDRSRGPIMTLDGDPLADYQFHVFDLWEDMGRTTSRVANLRRWFANPSLENLSGLNMVKHTLVDCQPELDHLEDLYLGQGYEGLMLRHFDGVYKHGTSTEKEGHLLKIKRFNEAEAVIVGFGEQMENTNPQEIKEDGSRKRSSAKIGKVGKGTLGYFVVKDVKTGKQFEIGGGPGVTDQFRRDVWNNQGLYLGQMLRYRYQEIGTKDLPRLPQFAGWRNELDYLEEAT